MGGREALDVAEGSGGIVAVEAEEKKIGDSNIVERGGNARIEAESGEGVAEEEERFERYVVEGFDAEMIASAEKCAGVCVPDGEGEIATEVRDAVGSPEGVGVEKEFLIARSGRDLAAGGG